MYIFSTDILIRWFSQLCTSNWHCQANKSFCKHLCSLWTTSGAETNDCVPHPMRHLLIKLHSCVFIRSRIETVCATTAWVTSANASSTCCYSCPFHNTCDVLKSACRNSYLYTEFSSCENQGMWENTYLACESSLFAPNYIVLQRNNRRLICQEGGLCFRSVENWMMCLIFIYELYSSLGSWLKVNIRGCF